MNRFFDIMAIYVCHFYIYVCLSFLYVNILGLSREF